MLVVIWAVVVLAAFTVGLSIGMLIRLNIEEEKASARVIRPAHITVHRHYHVKEYNVTDGQALDIDYPPTEKVG